MNAPQTGRNQGYSLSSIGWRRGPGRGGTFGEDTPLLGPLPTPASRGEEGSKPAHRTSPPLINPNVDENSRMPHRFVSARGPLSTINSQPPIKLWQYKQLA